MRVARVAGLVVIALFCSVSTAGSEMIPLIFTVPSTNALRTVSPEGDEGIECTGGEETHDVAWIRAWRLPISGGSWHCLDSLNVRGKEGLTDTLWVDPGEGAHFYIDAVDTVRNVSCASNTVYSGPITSVPEKPGLLPPATRTEYFDVHGRRIYSIRASGIYFYRVRAGNGAVIRKGRIMVLK